MTVRKRIPEKLPALAIATIFIIIAAGGAWAQAVMPVARLPVIQVAPGYAPEIEIIKIIARRVNLQLTSKIDATDKDLEKDGKKAFETLIIVIGGSGKGLGAAGVSLDDEVARAAALIAKAKKLGMFIIGIHSGGADRRGPNTEALLPVELPFLNYLIIRADGNADGVFTKAAKDYKYPISVVENTMDLQGLFKKAFNLP
jgi:hypothetical protein